MDAKLLSVLLWLALFQISFSASGQAKSFDSVPDLEKSMYTQIEGYPCVRLLNISGEIGCSNPGRANVVAPIVRFKNINQFHGAATILVPINDFEILLARLSEDPGLLSKVAGVLVESRIQTPDGLKGDSPDVRFPLAEFAPYERNNFNWNPEIVEGVFIVGFDVVASFYSVYAHVTDNYWFMGSGLMWKGYNFPVFLLSDASTAAVQKVVLESENTKKSYTEEVAEFDLVMQTTKSGTHDSESCLKEGTCLPLGGYSVWSALPPSTVSSSVKPIILTITSMDSASFFRDKSLGAESPISGLISMLAAVESLSRLDGLADLFNKQLVFLILTGESWGYLGSRRFLLESDQHSDTTKGLDMDMVDVVLEIGSVGKSYLKGKKTLFAHTAGATSSTAKVLDALQHAQGSLISDNIAVETASTLNPGVPPSSLMSFLRKKPEIAGVVLEDFDTAFANKFYHSHLDDISNINTSAIVSAASLVARTLYILASGDNNSSIDAIKVNTSVVEELVACLLTCEPGLSCDLVKRYISPSATCPNHYVGVILGQPSSAPYASNAGDISRFLWNYLADKTSILSKNVSSACPKNCNGIGELCIGEEADGKGICMISTTRHVPAYSTRLQYESGGWTLLPVNSSDVMNKDDAVWTESNWDTLSVRLYSVQSTSYDQLILLLGVIVTMLAYLVIVMTRTFIRKALKQE